MRAQTQACTCVCVCARERARVSPRRRTDAAARAERVPSPRDGKRCRAGLAPARSARAIPGAVPRDRRRWRVALSGAREAEGDGGPSLGPWTAGPPQAAVATQARPGDCRLSQGPLRLYLAAPGHSSSLRGPGRPCPYDMDRSRADLSAPKTSSFLKCGIL